MIDGERIACRGWSIDVICSPANDGDDERLNLGRFDGAQIQSFFFCKNKAAWRCDVRLKSAGRRSSFGGKGSF